MGDPEPLSWQQKVLLQVIYDAFRRTGEWPTYDYVDRILDRTYKIEADVVVRSLPRGFLRPDWPHIRDILRADHRLQPTIEAIAHWGGAWDDLDLLVRLLRVLIDKESEFVPSSPSAVEFPTATSTEVEEALAAAGRRPSFEELDRVLVLLDSDPLTNSGWSKAAPGSWSLTLSRQLRRYRDVYGVSQYLQRRREIAEEREIAATATTPTRPGVKEEATDEEVTLGPEDYWGRPTFVGLLGIFALVLGLAAAVPVRWWWKVLIVLVVTPLAMFLISRFSRPINRLATFLARLPPPRQPALTAGVAASGSLTLTVIRAGASLQDPEAARVISEDVYGGLHVEEVLARDADVEKAMRDTIPRLMAPVRSLRAMRGNVELARWRPNIWQRLRWSWGGRRSQT